MNESTFSLAQIWAQGDASSHAVAIMLVLMSVASWSVMIVKAWNLMKLRQMSAQAKAFWIKGKTKIKPKGLDLEFYLEDRAPGRLTLMAFRGTAGKPFAHYSFKTAARRAA